MSSLIIVSRSLIAVSRSLIAMSRSLIAVLRVLIAASRTLIAVLRDVLVSIILPLKLLKSCNISNYIGKLDYWLIIKIDQLRPVKFGYMNDDMDRSRR